MAAVALKGVSLAAWPGRITCLLGRNGVGKTSLLRAWWASSGFQRRRPLAGET